MGKAGKATKKFARTKLKDVLQRRKAHNERAGVKRKKQQVEAKKREDVVAVRDAARAKRRAPERDGGDEEEDEDAVEEGSADELEDECVSKCSVRRID